MIFGGKKSSFCCCCKDQKILFKLPYMQYEESFETWVYLVL